MKKIIILTFFLFLGIFATVNSQQSKQQKPANEFPVLKPTFIVSDIYVAFTLMESIDLKGSEVEAFLDVKKHLSQYLDDATKKQLKATDNTTVEMPANIAQNVLTFLSRATLKGNIADQYQRFVNALVEASKQLQPK